MEIMFTIQFGGYKLNIGTGDGFHKRCLTKNPDPLIR
jgi:hypothetical protein